MRDFLPFTREHSEYTFEQTLDLFLTALGQGAGSKPWQIQQAGELPYLHKQAYLTKVDRDPE